MFNRTNQAAPARGARRSTSFSVIGPDMVVTGDISTSENLQVSGRVDGDIRCAELHQAAGSAIAGAIVADEVRLAGLVDGTVAASLVTIEASARVSGEICYSTLSIESGARVDGRLVHRDEQQEETTGRTSLAEIFPHEHTAEAAE